MSNRRVRRYRIDEGSKVIILGPPGRIYTYGAVIDVPVRMEKLANGDVEKFCVEIPNAPKPRKACKEMLRIGRALGIQKSAKTFLKSCE